MHAHTAQLRSDWWWRWRRNVSFFLSLSLSSFLSLFSAFFLALTIGSINIFWKCVWAPKSCFQPICFVVEDLAESIKRNLPIGLLCRWFEPGLQVPGFSRHSASRHLSRNTLDLFICRKQSKLFQIIQHHSTTTCSTDVFQMFSALKTVSGNARLQEVWHFRHEQKTRWLDIQNFFGNWRKSLNFGVFATLNLKFFWGSSPRPPAKCNPPFLIPWLRAWSHPP